MGFSSLWSQMMNSTAHFSKAPLAEFCSVLLSGGISTVPNLIFSAQAQFYQRK